MTDLRVLFCLPLISPGHARRFEEEADALEALGISYDVISIEAVADGAWDLVLDRLPRRPGARYLFRGLMLLEQEHRALAEELEGLGHHLITSTEDYACSHYLPEYFDLIEPFAAPTTWIEGFDMDEAWEAACSLGPVDRMVKDHVKSAKEQWWRSAFIPASCTRERFEGVCQSLMAYRGERLERGLVFRALQPLRRLPASAQEMPLFEEYRMFFWRGQLLGAWPYHDAPGHHGVGSTARWEAIAREHDAPFFSLDVARRADGDWMVMELGDGGVTGLPKSMNALELYEAILDAEHDQEGF